MWFWEIQCNNPQRGLGSALHFTCLGPISGELEDEELGKKRNTRAVWNKMVYSWYRPLEGFYDDCKEYLEIIIYNAMARRNSLIRCLIIPPLPLLHRPVWSHTPSLPALPVPPWRWYRQRVRQPRLQSASQFLRWCPQANAVVSPFKIELGIVTQVCIWFSRIAEAQVQTGKSACWLLLFQAAWPQGKRRGCTSREHPT